MSENWSAGPWWTGPDLENCGGGFNVMARVGEREVRVAHTAEVLLAGECYVSAAEAQANGYLAAAAPEMAEALELAVKQMEAFGMVDLRPEGWEKSTYQVAVAALKKARGR